MLVALVACCLPSATALLSAGDTSPTLSQADGYRGCWYSIGPTKTEYKFKYSGGMATYPQQHAPIAIYSAAAHKTFFVYGGAAPGGRSILHMVAYFDHATGSVPRPTILLDKQTDDAHDNPTLAIDAQGHLLVFSNAHGTSRPAFVHRSVEPYSIRAFEKVWETNFSYGSPWTLADGSLLLLHTKYNQGRGLRYATSPNGRNWSEPKPLAKIEDGDYQISWPRLRSGAVAGVGTVFDFHPAGKGLDSRTNLYYLETIDAGQSWQTVAGQTVTLPLTTAANPALVHNYAAERRLVYMKDLNYDAAGRPVILYLTSTGAQPGPGNGPQQWQTAQWTGAEWLFRPVTTSDHNYDHGSLYIEADAAGTGDGLWRIIAPTAPGPQPFGTGGEMQLWTSSDRGGTWQKTADLTSGSTQNHTYARRPLNAHADFYALWADGNAREPSESSLYFCNQTGNVWRLPRTMTDEVQSPEQVR